MGSEDSVANDKSITNLEFHDLEYKFEMGYWGDCVNTFLEEQKHFVQARYMGLEVKNYRVDVGGKRILDIGGGPVSMLLKTTNLREGMVCDPIKYPDWVIERYRTKGIKYVQIAGEELDVIGWDEVWIYNVLQHCVDPEQIIRNARRAGSVIRLFEWIDFPPHPGHPQMLTAANLERWLGSKGNAVRLSESGCYGNSFSGVFKQV